MSHNSQFVAGASDPKFWAPLQETTGTTVEDISSNGYDGTISGMGANPTTEAGPNSYLTSAFSYDKVDDRILVSNLGDEIDGQASWSIAMFAKLYSYGESLGGRFFQLTASNISGRTPSNENAYFIHEGNDFNSGVDVVDSSWHTLVFRKTATTKEIIIDGVEYSEADSGSTTTSGEGIYFGNNNGSRTIDGALANLVVSVPGMSDTEADEYADGPEINYVSGVSFTDAGVFNVGTWSLPSPFASGTNGTAVYSVIAVESDGTVIDTAATSSGTLDLSSLGGGETAYLMVRATNDGGFDVGDFSTRTSGYGSADDGYYEIASVTVASTGGPFRRIAGRGLLG